MEVSHNSLELIAPLSGVTVPLENVPDPVFSQKMMGEGLAIDPTDNILRAPCAGKVVQLHSSKHALTIETDNGTQVLLHIGLDTVNLKGRGFSAKVSQGDQVSTGQELIEFDTDLVALAAKSLITIMVVIEGSASESINFLKTNESLVEAGKTSFVGISFEENTEQRVESQLSQETFQSVPFFVRLPSGMHARPAAQLAELTKKYQSKIEIIKDGKAAPLSSLVSLMGLEIQRDDEIHILATGSDANAAVRAVLESLVLLEEKELASFEEEKLEESTLAQLQSDERTIVGVKASSGVVAGHTVVLKEETFDIEETSEDKDSELNKLESGMKAALGDLEDLVTKLEDKGDNNKASIFAAHKALLEDPDLVEESVELINSGSSAAYAWDQTIQKRCQHLLKLKNEMIAGRANDLKDIGQRVLKHMLGIKEENKFASIKDAILIAEDLTPSDMAMFEEGKVIGFCTTLGGATSHVAIMARAMGIPALAAVEKRILELADAREVILDADRGAVLLDPTTSEMEEITARREEIEKKKQKALSECMQPARTKDGHTVEVVANISGVTDAEKTVSVGGEGVGLLRTEFLFLERDKAPTEDEQFKIYQAIADALGERPLVIRTMDVGGDKALKYINLEKEENPFLGVRGIRLSLENEELFRMQLRALLRVNSKADIHIMFPMVGQLSELKKAKAILEEERAKLNASPLKVGIMVEVPSAAVMAEQLAKEVDFFSIGTNDLTQYALAMDRGHNSLAKQVDGLHPAVLNLIALTIKGAHKHSKWVGLCGGIASDAVAAPVLLGLGVDELSLSIPQIPLIKSSIRSLNKNECEKLASEALSLGSAEEVRKLVLKKWPHLA